MNYDRVTGKCGSSPESVRIDRYAFSPACCNCREERRARIASRAGSGDIGTQVPEVVQTFPVVLEVGDSGNRAPMGGVAKKHRRNYSRTEEIRAWRSQDRRTRRARMDRV